MNTNLKIYFSLLSGDIYYINEDEVKSLDKYQIPLIKKPKSNCKHCHGRGFEGQNLRTKMYELCRCMQKCIDFQTAKEFIDAEKITLQ